MKKEQKKKCKDDRPAEKRDYNECPHGYRREECRHCRRLMLLKEFGKGLEKVNEPKS